jgi:hypothetical protein
MVNQDDDQENVVQSFSVVLNMVSKVLLFDFVDDD